MWERAPETPWGVSAVYVPGIKFGLAYTSSQNRLGEARQPLYHPQPLRGVSEKLGANIRTVCIKHQYKNGHYIPVQSGTNHRCLFSVHVATNNEPNRIVFFHFAGLPPVYTLG